MLNMAVAPSDMPLKLTLEGCGVRANWNLPNNGGSPINNIQFEVRISATSLEKSQKNFVP